MQPRGKSAVTVVRFPDSGELWSVRACSRRSYVAVRAVFSLPVLHEFIQLGNRAEVELAFGNAVVLRQLQLQQAALVPEQRSAISLRHRVEAIEFFAQDRIGMHVLQGLERIFVAFNRDAPPEVRYRPVD